MRLTRAATGLVVGALAVLLITDEMSADVGDGQETEATVDEDGDLRAAILLDPSWTRDDDEGGGSEDREGWWNNPNCNFGPMISSSSFPEVEREIDGVVHDLYLAGCLGGGGLVWVPRLTAAMLLPGAVEEVRSKIPAPAVSFLHLDPDFGWAYVTVPQDFRVTNLEPVSASASAQAGPASAWVTVTATPSMVTFASGEPRGWPVSCSVEGAVAGYVAEAPGECSYTYRDSSAISANGRTFETVTTVEWSISYSSSSGGGVLDPFAASSSVPLGVAEVQALIVCTGPRPEQGGC